MTVNEIEEGSFLSTLKSRIEEQQWYQELKAKWDELDAQSQLYLRLAGVFSFIVVLFIFVISYWISVSSLKSEFREKTEVTRFLSRAQNEIRDLKAMLPNPEGALPSSQTDWKPIFEGIAESSGLTKDKLELSPEKIGATQQNTKEHLFDLKVKDLSVRQLTQIAFQLENGGHPIKTRAFTVRTIDATGRLEAQFSLSAFSVEGEK